ncbi:MAG: NUMOD3 domain-containing DNA-binding protein [Bacteroidales bacterium]|nr:NUMOD3 domain-containing DNA-binding protein [Bacteroidales bacterium]
MRSKLSGMKLSEETKKKISESNKGKHKESPSDEARQKMSESHKGLTVWNKGKHYNEE